jgi:hypothetical protein
MPNGTGKLGEATKVALEIAVLQRAIGITARTVAIANTRIPVDTGEARASARITLNEPSRDQSSEPYIQLTGADVRRAAQINGMTIGDTLVTTWVANHASILERGRAPDRNGVMTSR